jgi:hypothetical protein
MNKLECTPYPWMVRLMQADGEPAFAVYEHTVPVIAVDREYWPDSYERPVEKGGYFPIEEYSAVMANRMGVVRMILLAPAMYHLLGNMLEFLDTHYPAEKYPHDIEHPEDKQAFAEWVIARDRESIRDILQKVQTGRGLKLMPFD